MNTTDTTTPRWRFERGPDGSNRYLLEGAPAFLIEQRLVFGAGHDERSDGWHSFRDGTELGSPCRRLADAKARVAALAA